MKSNNVPIVTPFVLKEIGFSTIIYFFSVLTLLDRLDLLDFLDFRIFLFLNLLEILFLTIFNQNKIQYIISH